MQGALRKLSQAMMDCNFLMRACGFCMFSRCAEKLALSLYCTAASALRYGKLGLTDAIAARCGSAAQPAPAWRIAMRIVHANVPPFNRLIKQVK
jgi:uncharacterized protein (DUF934 family)